MTNSAVDDRITSTVIEASRLRRFVELIFEKAGMPPDEADLLARHLIWAELRGVSSLGLNKVSQYLDRLRGGHTSYGQEPVRLFSRAGFLAVDGRHGFGQVVGHRVMEQVIETARLAGIGAAVVRNTTSAGALGYYVMQAVEQQMVGLAINNGPPLLPAPGGAEKVLGNQAFAIASPAGRHHPLLLDMALSAISLARIHDHQLRGEPLPEGVAVTANGEPTVDPVGALDGMLLPAAGHRGFGLALLWEVLTGVLAGGEHFSTDVGWPTETHRPQGVSLLLVAIDPTVSLSFESFVSRVDDLIDRIHHSRLAVGAQQVTVPGERSAATMARREAKGIPVPDPLLATLRTLATRLGVVL